MKVRIHNDSLRIRVTQSEVARLAAGERIEQTTFFTTIAKLICSIEPISGLANARVIFEGSQLTLRLPTSGVKRWADSEEVGIEAVQPIDASRALHILLEKDFQCLHGDTVENEDAFPNPLAGKIR